MGINYHYACALKAISADFSICAHNNVFSRKNTNISFRSYSLNVLPVLQTAIIPNNAERGLKSMTHRQGGKRKV